MKITTKWLQYQNACAGGVAWFENQRKTNDISVLKELQAQGRLDWANWLIVRVMTRPQYLSYAIFAAESVIDIYERKYSDDKRPRNAIEAAKKVLENDTEENRVAANGAAYAAYGAYYAAYYAAYAAYSAANGAYYAADAAYYAADVADVAADAAADAADVADVAADVAGAEMKNRILNFGLKLLEAGK